MRISCRNWQAMEDSMKSLRHDIKNHLLVLQEMAGKHDFSDMDRYVESLNDMVEQSRPFSETGNVIVDSLLNIKLKAGKPSFGNRTGAGVSCTVVPAYRKPRSLHYFRKPAG